jgi:hypothetical protein
VSPPTRELQENKGKRVLSLLMWAKMWFISHCSHVNYIPKIQTLFLKEIWQNRPLNPLTAIFTPFFFNRESLWGKDHTLISLMPW